jgi:hypothetical protein
MSNLAIERPPSLAEIVPFTRQLATVDKLRLIRILAEDLETDEDIAPFVAGKTYHIATAYDTAGAARTFADAMSSLDDSTTL